jgi:hypothetical protein
VDVGLHWQVFADPARDAAAIASASPKHPVQRLLDGLRSVLRVSLCVVGVILLSINLPLGLFALATVGLSLLMRNSGKALYRLRLRRSLDAARDEFPLRVSLDHTGVCWSGAKSTVRLHWSVFERWVEHPDGVLLVQPKSRAVAWVPNRGADHSTWADATSMVASQIGAAYAIEGRRR